MSGSPIDPTGAIASADQAKIVAEQNQKIGNSALEMMQKAMSEFTNSSDMPQPRGDLEEEVVHESIVEPADSTEVEEANEEDEVVEEVATPKEKLLSKEAKYRKLQKDKYRALAEKEEALRKIEELERMLNDSLNYSNYHTSKSAQAELEKAKQDKRIAIESGDLDGLIAADIALAEAIASVNEAKKWNAQINLNAQKAAEPSPKTEYVPAPKQPEQNNYNSMDQEIAYDWLDNHTYLQPGSMDYNPMLARQVSKFVNHLDDNLRKNNQMDLYFSEDYFDTIDEFIAENMKKSKKIDRSIINASHIGGVRHGHTPSVNGGVVKKSKTPEISDMEKLMMKHAGIPESSLIKAKINLAKEGKL
jgi:hypothetical protein